MIAIIDQNNYERKKWRLFLHEKNFTQNEIEKFRNNSVEIMERAIRNRRLNISHDQNPKQKQKNDPENPKKDEECFKNLLVKRGSPIRDSARLCSSSMLKMH